MPLTGSQLAYKSARFGIMRFGASRFGYFTPTNVVIDIGGVVQSQVIVDSVRITLAINDEPDTARFVIRPSLSETTVAGQLVVIGWGTSVNAIFGGQIQRVTYARQTLTPGEITMAASRPFLEVECADWSGLFDRRLVTTLYTSQSASLIARDIVATYTSGFTAAHIPDDLPSIEYFPCTNERPTTALRRLANLIGGGFYIDPLRDVHLWTGLGETGARAPTAPLPLTDGLRTLKTFRHTYDGSQRRTRLIVEGATTRLLGDVLAGDTIIPVVTTAAFPASGAVRLEQQVVTYTATQEGGAGSLVGPGVAPPSPPVANAQAGAGIENGPHSYAFTWVTASGETLPSPGEGPIHGPISAPSAVPNRAATGGIGLSVGTYTYAVTFKVGSGETTSSPIGTVVTSAGIPPPTTSPTATAATNPPTAHTGGRYAVGDSVWIRCSYLDANGGETGGTDSNTVIVGAYSGSTPNIVLAYNIPVPPAPNSQVVGKRLYLNVNGAFVAYTEFAPPVTDFPWIGAEGSTSGFPIGSATDRKQVTLTGIPSGSSIVTARVIYRTDVNGSQLKLVTTINDNTTDSYIDATADGALGANIPTSNTTVVNQTAVSNIATGPTGVTSRKVYRTVAGGTQLKLLTTIADNSTTTFSDSTPDGSLGANAPSSDTSALETTTGQVNTGSTSILVAGPGLFSASGGWALIGNQAIRYTGISGSSLTGVPETGSGSIQATVSYGEVIEVAPSFTGIPASGVGSLTRAVTRDVDVVLRVTRDDTTAQAAAVIVEGGDGIHEHIVADHRLSADGATEVADADLASFSRELTDTDWETEDWNARPGVAQTIGPTALADELMIQDVEITFYMNGRTPVQRRRCRASSVRVASVIDVLREMA